MFQVFLLLCTSFAAFEDAAHRTDARNCAQRHRPVAFVTEGLRLVLCFPSTAESGFKEPQRPLAQKSPKKFAFLEGTAEKGGLNQKAPHPYQRGSTTSENRARSFQHFCPEPFY